MITLPDITATICKAERRTDADYVSAKIRGLVDRGFLTPVGRDGGLRTNRMDDMDLFRARILVAALETGFRAERVKMLLFILNRRLSEVLENIETETYALEICRINDHVGGDPNADSIGWMKRTANGDWYRGTAGRADPLADDAYVIGGTIESVTIIPVTALLRPIVQYTKAQA